MDLAFTVNDYRYRQRVCLIEENLCLFPAKGNRIIDPELPHELSYFPYCLWRIGDAKDLQPFALILTLHLNEIRHLCAAGRAPRRPEIKKQHFAFVVTESNCVA